MKKMSLIITASIVAFATSCGYSLMTDTDMDSVDWGSVDENTFIGENNAKAVANGDLVLYMRHWPNDSDKYYLYFITSSDDFYINFRLDGEPFMYPINEKGVLSFDHFVSEGLCSVTLKENGPFFPSVSHTHCKLLIDCEVKRSGGYQQLESGIYGDKMKGKVQLKIVTTDGKNYKFSFNGLTPFLDNSEWKSTGSPYE